jgi:hypothetical protein
LSLGPNEYGWKKVEGIIDDMFQKRDKVMIESLGASEDFRDFYEALSKKYPIKMIRIFADLETCFTRVKTPSNKDHIAVSDDKVLEYNKIAATVTYDWDSEIDNDGYWVFVNLKQSFQTTRRIYSTRVISDKEKECSQQFQLQ